MNKKNALRENSHCLRGLYEESSTEGFRVTSMVIVSCLTVVLFVDQALAAYATIIDDFKDGVPKVTVTRQDVVPVIGGTTVEGQMLGGELDVLLQLVDANATGEGIAAAIGEGVLRYTQDPSCTGKLVIHWDGMDASATEVRASTGLGGIDITDGGTQDGIQIQILSNATSAKMALVLYSDPNSLSALTWTIPPITGPTAAKFSFSNFVPNGDGAVLTSIRAILVMIGLDGGMTGPADISIASITTTPINGQITEGRPCCPAWSCAQQAQGETNADGLVDLLDLAVLGRAWPSDSGDADYECLPDFDRNGHIDMYDLTLLGEHWLQDAFPVSPIMAIEAQCSARNCPCTACGGPADPQDGAFVNLSSTVGGFMWRASVMPMAKGRNCLSPDWTLRTNSRAYSCGGWFGTTPATLACFERIYRRCDGSLVYQDKHLRDHVFDLQPVPGTPSGGDPRSTAGATAQGLYAVLRESDTEIAVRHSNGTLLTFNALDDTPTAGALRTIQDRLGDTITYYHNEIGQVTAVTDVFGRGWNFTYDSRGRLERIVEDERALMGRFVTFSYDKHNRLEEIRMTPSLNDGGIGNQYPDGKAYRLRYPPARGDLSRDTNIIAVIYPSEVHDGSNAPRIENTYYSDDRLEKQVWGGINSSGIPAGGTLTYSYGPDLTTVTDRNGNRTTYTFNDSGLAIRVEEFANRRIRGGADPTSLVTRMTYNEDMEFTELTKPLGNKLQLTYDTANPNRYAHGNLSKATRKADPERGGDGQGSEVNDLVKVFHYEPIFQQVRVSISECGNDPDYVPFIADDESNVQDLDFNLDGDQNDPADGEILRTRRYSTVTIFDYQEGLSSQIKALASREDIKITDIQATALSLGADLNRDGLTSQQRGLPIEVRAPSVTLEDGSLQRIIRDYRWNSFGLLKEEIGPQGYVTQYKYSPAANPSERTGTSPDEGGYLFQTITDATPPQIRTPSSAPPGTAPVAAASTVHRDNVGNVIATIDPRGVKHTFVVNEYNHIQVAVRAAGTSGVLTNPDEPRTLYALHYETRSHYDADGRLIRSEVENVVDEGGGQHKRVNGNPWWESTYVYDILGNLVERNREIAAGETCTLRGYAWPIGPPETVTIRQRFDRNQNPVLGFQPLAVAGIEPNNISSSIFDERDTLWKTTDGGIDPQWSTLTAHEDIPEWTGVTRSISVAAAGSVLAKSGSSEAVSATMRSYVDGNGNPWLYVDAQDHGAAHDGTDGLRDTDDPTVEGLQRGDPYETVYDGHNRAVYTNDPMGYHSEMAYDPHSNLVALRMIGPAGSNHRGGSTADRLLASMRTRYDELSRPYRHEADYMREPLETPVVEDVYVSRTWFDSDSRVLREIRPMGDYKETLYDGKGRPVLSRTNPVSGSGPTARTVVPCETHRRFDDNDSEIQRKEIDRSSERDYEEVFYTDYFHDALNRQDLVISSHFPLTLEANASRTEYDSRNNIVATVNANSSTAGPLAGRFKGSTLDRGGPVAVQINQGGNAAVHFHDGLGREVASVRELRVDHDGANPLDTSNPKNSDGLITIGRKWDRNSRLVQIHADLDTSQAPGPLNPSRTAFEYDSRNRLVRVVNADGTASAREYDRDSLLRHYEDENHTSFHRTYDDLHRLTRIDVEVDPDSDTAATTTGRILEYDGLSRSTKLVEGIADANSSEITRSFDSRSQMLAERQTVAGIPGPAEMGYEYDKDGNLIQIVYPDGRKITYGYGYDGTGCSSCASLDQIKRIEEGPGTGSGPNIVPSGAPELLIERYEYLGAERIERRISGTMSDAGGVVQEKAYDALGRVSLVKYSHRYLGNDFAKYGYLYDKVHNLLVEEHHHTGGPATSLSGVQSLHSYDSANRLTREVLGEQMFATVANNQASNPDLPSVEHSRSQWQLDGRDNWAQVEQAPPGTLTTITANEMNEYVRIDGQEREHDDNGNLNADSDFKYVYDAFNRLVKVVEPSAAHVVAEYTYDALDRCIRRDKYPRDPASTAAHVVAEYTSDALDRSTPRDSNTRGSASPTIEVSCYVGNLELDVRNDEGVIVLQNVWGPDGLRDYFTEIGPYSYLHFNVHENGQGSIMYTTPRGSEYIADAFTYSAYGEQRLGETEMPTGVPYGFQGWRLDPETGLYNPGGGIMFDPDLGRAITRPYAWGANNLLWQGARGGIGGGDIRIWANNVGAVGGAGQGNIQMAQEDEDKGCCIKGEQCASPVKKAHCTWGKFYPRYRCRTFPPGNKPSVVCAAVTSYVAPDPNPPGDDSNYLHAKLKQELWELREDMERAAEFYEAWARYGVYPPQLGWVKRSGPRIMVTPLPGPQWSARTYGVTRDDVLCDLAGECHSSTIQHAVDLASRYDTVEIWPGLYPERVTICDPLRFVIYCPLCEFSRVVATVSSNDLEAQGIAQWPNVIPEGDPVRPADVVPGIPGIGVRIFCPVCGYAGP